MDLDTAPARLPASDGGRPADAVTVAQGARPGRGSVSGTWRDYVRAALTPRMLGIFVLLLAAAVVAVRLGAWQLDRAAIRGAAEAEAAYAEMVSADPEPLSEVLRAQTSFTADELARPVQVRGSFEPEHQVLVPDRVAGGEAAVLVVTALRIADGPDAGAVLPVLRGWVSPDAVRTESGRAVPADDDVAAALAVPAGERRVTGYLGAGEAGRPGDDLPEGMVAGISTGQLTGEWGGPGFSGYLVEFTEEPDGERSDVSPSGLAHAPAPAMAQETGLNIQNLAYAVEWVLFGGFALFLGARVLRDEVRNRREEAAAASEDTGTSRAGSGSD